MHKDVDYLEVAEEVAEMLEEAGFEVVGKQDFETHAQYQLKKDGKLCGFMRFYQSGDGTTIDDSQVKEQYVDEVRNVLEGYVELPKEEESRAKDFQEYDVIGVDESGKGDFFGPLVVAAAYVPDQEATNELKHLGLADSKRISDDKVADLAKDVKRLCQYSIVKLPPKTYNDLYEDMGNLNDMLGWAHARSIEDLLEDGVVPEAAISDKFGREDFIEDKLMGKGRDIELFQEVRAEENIAVAAASVLARSEFLKKLGSLAVKWNVELPLGAGENVVAAGKSFIDEHGEEQLGEVAKLHFKTTEKVKS